jgi:hypothetical protein
MKEGAKLSARQINYGQSEIWLEADGVEPDISVENAQLTDSVNARIGIISKNAKSTVRSLYSLFPDLPETPKAPPSDVPDFCERAF